MLVAAFVLVPLVEIWAILQVGQLVGPWWTIALLVLDSVVGAWLIKREGGRAWQALRQALQGGRMPARELADGALDPDRRHPDAQPRLRPRHRGDPADPALHPAGGAAAADHGRGAAPGRRTRLRRHPSVPETDDAPDPGPKARWSGATSSTESSELPAQTIRRPASSCWRGAGARGRSRRRAAARDAP